MGNTFDNKIAWEQDPQALQNLRQDTGKMEPYGRKENYEKIIIKKEDTTNQNVK